MAIWNLSLLFAGAAFAHTGVKHITIDGVSLVPHIVLYALFLLFYSYPPYDGRIDHLLGPVKRIEWTRDVVGGPFQPITNFSDPALACMS